MEIDSMEKYTQYLSFSLKGVSFKSGRVSAGWESGWGPGWSISSFSLVSLFGERHWAGGRSSPFPPSFLPSLSLVVRPWGVPLWVGWWGLFILDQPIEKKGASAFFLLLGR